MLITRFCKKQYIIVPTQAQFGHHTRWLKPSQGDRSPYIHIQYIYKMPKLHKCQYSTHQFYDKSLRHLMKEFKYFQNLTAVIISWEKGDCHLQTDLRPTCCLPVIKWRAVAIAAVSLWARSLHLVTGMKANMAWKQPSLTSHCPTAHCSLLQTLATACWTLKQTDLWSELM